MFGHPIVVIGASAGGVEGLLSLARSLPIGLRAAVFMVLHIPPHSSSVLPQLLSRAKGLPAAHPRDGELIHLGRIYVAPPDRHLLLDRTHVQLGCGPYDNCHRPAVDTLFRAAARWHGPRVIGVVLSGALDDGTSGLSAIKLAGGVTVVQDPAEAMYPSMPQSALDHVSIDYVASLAGLGPLITRLVQQAALPSAIVPSNCPSELTDAVPERFPCSMGPVSLPQSLADSQAERVQAALWVALRALKECSALSLRMAERASRRKMETLASASEMPGRAVGEHFEALEGVLKNGHQQAETPIDGTTDDDRVVCRTERSC
jgi:two-component system chemotaxis response regulator CheB